MQPADVDMRVQKREPPARDEPQDRKKHRLDDVYGHDEWSGWYTKRDLGQWMGSHFANIVEREATCRLSEQGLMQFLVTSEMVKIYHDSNKTKVGAWNHEVAAWK